jgi:hypothetical protein
MLSIQERDFILQGHLILSAPRRISENPYETVISFEWDDLESSKICRMEDLMKTMQKVRVMGKPDIYFLKELEQTPT